MIYFSFNELLNEVRLGYMRSKVIINSLDFLF